MNYWWNMFLRARDFRFALYTFWIVLGAAALSDRLRASSHVLDVSAALSVAILAIVLGGLSILVAFLTDDYARLLASTKGGIAGAIRPYTETAVISGITATVSLAGLFFWPIAGPAGRTIALAVALAMTMWTVVGTVELVGITARHGILRGRLPEIEDAYRGAKEKQKVG